MAPEVVLMKGHSTKADIWSLGCLTLEMLTSKPPYSDITTDIKEIFKLVTSGTLPNYPSSLSINCKDFLD